jgi:hypothetical protein
MSKLVELIMKMGCLRYKKRKPVFKAGFRFFHLVTFTLREEALLSITQQTYNNSNTISKFI